MQVLTPAGAVVATQQKIQVRMVALCALNLSLTWQQSLKKLDQVQKPLRSILQGLLFCCASGTSKFLQVSAIIPSLSGFVKCIFRNLTLSCSKWGT